MASRSWFPPWNDRNPNTDHRGFKTQVDSLFEDWFGRSMGGVLAPRIDLTEDDSYVVVTVELPGINETDIDVFLNGNQLTIKGEKRSQHDHRKEPQRHALHRRERLYGAFHRTITLPYRVNPDQVSAQSKDGVLTITLPKPSDAAEQKQGRKIEINKPENATQATPPFTNDQNPSTR